MTLATFCRNEHFTARCFIYYKAIAIAELFYMSFKACGNLIRAIYAYDFWSYPFQLSRTIIPPAYSFCIIADILVIYLSIERSVACLIPTRFHLIDVNGVSYAVIITAVVIGNAISAPYLFSRTIITDKSGKITVALSSLWSEKAEETHSMVIEAYCLIEGILIFISTGFAIAGTVQSILYR